MPISVILPLCLSMVSSITVKQKIARLMRWPLLHKLMLWSMKLVVPRQRIGVSMIALDESECVLFLKHVFHPSIPWGLPGGWVARNEAPARGILRELYEETGLTAVLGPIVHSALEDAPTHIGIAYLAQIQPGELKLSPEIIEARWFPLQNLPQLQYPFTEQAIRAAVQFHRLGNGQREECSFTIN
jgi:ADP-ribose pyrophosphatase YjhB (NUDIX family)